MFGEHIYTVTEVDGMFWAVCPSLGDSGTFQDASREELIRKVSEHTGKSPVEKAVPTRMGILETGNVRVFNDGVVDINMPGLRIKAQIFTKTGLRSPWQTSLSSGLEAESFHEFLDYLSDDLYVTLQIEKVALTYPDGSSEVIDFEGKLSKCSEFLHESAAYLMWEAIEEVSRPSCSVWCYLETSHRYEGPASYSASDFRKKYSVEEVALSTKRTFAIIQALEETSISGFPSALFFPEGTKEFISKFKKDVVPVLSALESL